MAQKQNGSPLKNNLHPRNKHRLGYDFEQLVKVYITLKKYIFLNPYKKESIDFSDPEAVKALNKALLIYYYGLTNWDIPENYLCPPIPGRADYIHYLADLLAVNNENIIPRGKSIKVLDIGVGANCIYPIIGNYEYEWSFVGSDIDRKAIDSAKKIISSNLYLQDSIQFRIQHHTQKIFQGIINPDEEFDLTMCNPPFHASKAEANKGTQRKWNNLGSGDGKNLILNFGGQNTELWTPGGEKAFVLKMISESEKLKTQCLWFTSLVSKSVNLPVFYNSLNYLGASNIKTINMAQGQKESRILAWSFLNQEQHEEWKLRRWNDI